MLTHHFTLIVDGPDMQDEAIINALFENGCDDGTVGRSADVQFIVFDREAELPIEAVQSAIEDIERIPGLKVVRIADADQVFASNMTEHTKTGYFQKNRTMAATNAIREK